MSKTPRSVKRVTVEQVRQAAKLREAGVPLVVEGDEPGLEGPELAGALLDGMTKAINQASPVPLKLAGDDGEPPSADELRAAYDQAVGWREEGDARTAESVGLKESAQKIREASAAGRSPPATEGGD